MRIVYLYQYFGTPKGSWSTRSYEFAKHWVDRGHDVLVVTSVYEKSDIRTDAWLSRQQVDGIDIAIINTRLSNSHGFLARVSRFLLFALVATWVVLGERADVLVASSGPITIGIPALIARWLKRTPLVFEVRDLWPDGAIELGVLSNPVLIAVSRWFEKRCYRASDAIISLSPDKVPAIRERAPAGAIVEVIENMADVRRFRPPNGGWTPSTSVVYAGSLGLMDDGAQIVELARELKRRKREDISITVLGDGSERERLQALASESGLGNITFRGLVPKEEVATILPMAAAALITFKAVPVLNSVSPNKLFDAFAAGTPVVQTTNGWIRTLLAAEECGFSVPPGDPGEFADAVIRLVDDPDLRRSMGARGRQLAEDRFSVDGLAGRALALLESVAPA